MCFALKLKSIDCKTTQKFNKDLLRKAFFFTLLKWRGSERGKETMYMLLFIIILYQKADLIEQDRLKIVFKFSEVILNFI